MISLRNLTFVFLSGILFSNPVFAGRKISSAPISITVSAASVPSPISANLAAAAQALQPGAWYQLPAKNKISDVYPIAVAGSNWTSATTGSKVDASNVVSAWGGGAVAEGKLFIWGGGHNNYGGNEVYTFDLDTWKWSRVTDPSNYKATPCGYTEPVGSCATVDGTPVSAHSYEGINYIPTLGKIWVGGGAVYSTAGGFGAQSNMFSLSANAWTKLPDMPRAGSIISAWDNASKKLLIILGSGSDGGGTFFTYNPANNKYENLSDPNWSVGSSGDFDPIGRKFVLYSGATNSNVYVYDFSNEPLLTTAGVGWDKFDFKPTFMNGAPFAPDLGSATGFIYNPDRKLFVLWDGQSSDVWTLDPLTWNWNKNTAITAGPPVSNTRGVYSRWRYLPDYKVFLAYDNVNSNPWIYKLP